MMGATSVGPVTGGARKVLVLARASARFCVSRSLSKLSTSVQPPPVSVAVPPRRLFTWFAWAVLDVDTFCSAVSFLVYI